MQITCPCCRATNESPTCRRCKADLSLLRQVEESRENLLALAREATRDLRYSDALDHLADAIQLRSSSDAKQLHAMIELLKGRFAEAYQLYQELQTS